MVNIDYIMELIDWNNTEENQKKGIELAKEVKCLNAFLQPASKYYSIGVWDNCAKILAMRSDEELSFVLTNLMMWLQDMNWPGALIILDRLRKFKNTDSLNNLVNDCIKGAKALNDDVWIENLNEIICPKLYLENFIKEVIDNFK